MQEVKDWIGRHVKLSPEDHRLIRYDSGKEMKAFEVTVANLISRGRASNLTDKGLVTSQAEDKYEISEAGLKELKFHEFLLSSLEDFDGLSDLNDDQ